MHTCHALDYFNLVDHNQLSGYAYSDGNQDLTLIRSLEEEPRTVATDSLESFWQINFGNNPIIFE